jgi:hypothetical protein
LWLLLFFYCVLLKNAGIDSFTLGFWLMEKELEAFVQMALASKPPGFQGRGQGWID